LSPWNKSRWAIITAYNPRSRALSDAENTDRDIALRHRLDRDSLLYFPALGISDAGRWTPEASVLVLGVSRGKAAALGRESAQSAIVWGKRGEPAELVWCNALKIDRP
jgi:hypothetical protein